MKRMRVGMRSCSSSISLFLSGDVMIGRGIDQLFPQSCQPHLFESYCQSALDYVTLAERHLHRVIPRPVRPEYIWGAALDVLRERAVDVSIINLETSITTSEDADREKEINYRAHPANVDALRAAKIDVCVLSNNHVLDWGAQGLRETLFSLHGADIRTCGAGESLDEAVRPAVVEIPMHSSGSHEQSLQQRVLVFSRGMPSSGVPQRWAAGSDRAGVAHLNDLHLHHVDEIAAEIASYRRDGDLVVFSIHWGSNWNYDVAAAERAFAHALIDRAQVDVVHGHSSHHVKGIEMYRGRVILYGCGDFINDYEGISGYESFRADLSLMYFVTRSAPSEALSLVCVPTSMSAFQVKRATPEDTQDLLHILRRECGKLNTAVEFHAGGYFTFSPST